VKIDRLENGLPRFKAKGVSSCAKLGPCRSASPDPGCEFFCRTCRRTILGHSGTRSSRLARRRPGRLSHLDSASPEQLIPSSSCREPPRHSLPHLRAVAASITLPNVFRSPPIPESIGECAGRRSIQDGTSRPASCLCAPAPDLCLPSRSLPRLRLCVRSSERG